MSAPHNIWLKRILDGLLLFSTVVAVGLGFWKGAPEWASMAVLVSFVCLFFLRWYISEHRNAYLKANWFDLVLVVLLASPALRLFMVFRAVGLLPALRIGALLRSNRERLLRIILLSQDSFPAAMVMVFGLVFVFGTAVFFIEHGQNPSFISFSDGLWWAFVTLTTVGYGDIVPITSAGRIVAVLTMVFGIAVYSLMIANLTFFVEEQGRKRRLAEEQKAAEKTQSK